MSGEFGIVAKWEDPEYPGVQFLGMAIVFSVRKSRGSLTWLFGKRILEESQRTAFLLSLGKTGTRVEIYRAQ